MKTGEELYCKVYQSPRLPRATLVPNSQHAQKDVLITDTSKSDGHENEVHKHKKTCGSNRVDFRIPGTPHSNVEQVETIRKETVRRLIEQFENHPNWKRLLKDFEKSEEINHFRQESKDLITEMGNTEIFEFYENSSKRQRPDCAAYWEIGIVHCTCGKCKQLTEKIRQFNKDRFDTLSIPGYVIKKNQSRGPWHGPSMSQTMYHKARDMLRKAKLQKNGSCQTTLERWYRDNKYRKSLSEEGWTEEHIRQYDELALGDHTYEATPGGRRRWEKNWHIFLNKEGKQGPIRQRPDVREAKHEYRQLYKEYA